MKKNAAIILTVLAVVLGIIIGLAEAEDKRYSYKS